jgi:hypothetical protein
VGQFAFITNVFPVEHKSNMLLRIPLCSGIIEVTAVPKHCPMKTYSRGGGGDRLQYAWAGRLLRPLYRLRETPRYLADKELGAKCEMRNKQIVD